MFVFDFGGAQATAADPNQIPKTTKSAMVTKIKASAKLTM